MTVHVVLWITWQIHIFTAARPDISIEYMKSKTNLLYLVRMVFTLTRGSPASY